MGRGGFRRRTDELDARALDLARKIAAKPPIALAMAKTMIDQIHAGAVRSGIAQELLAQTALFKTEDYQEARAALREKRTPAYKGSEMTDHAAELFQGPSRRTAARHPHAAGR
jgi:1,4-dihydroxy-2-naphthoyl-CoA synthase